MAPYDSDSSAGEEEEEEFTETNVLLGYASKDAGDDPTTRLGGRPEWLDPETPPSATLARCKICKDLMVLLLQLNAELPDRFPGHERRLYVFACRRKTCRRRDGSIRAVRSLRVEPGSGNKVTRKKEDKSKPKEEEEMKPPSNLGETLFGAKTLGGAPGANPFANPFATGGASTSSNPFSTAPKPAPEPSKPETKEEEAEEKTNKDLNSLPKTFAETLSLNNTQQQPNTTPTPPEPWPPESLQPKPYPISYLSDAEYETLDNTPLSIPQATKMEIDDGSSNSTGPGKEDKEVFESTMDAAFQRFADRLSQNPEQCIRYEFSGTPLLFSKTDSIGKILQPETNNNNHITIKSGIPRCPNCHAPRTFEVQLCPHAITELEAEELSLDGMDWGTIIVFVCERDCQPRGVDEGSVGYLEEWAGVQWEEMGANSPVTKRQ